MHPSRKTIIPTAVLAMGAIGVGGPATAAAGEPGFQAELGQLTKKQADPAPAAKEADGKQKKDVPAAEPEPAGLELDDQAADAGAVIDGFGVPIFLLPIYQAAGTEYGIRWEVLAAINEIETDYGRNLSVSSAGAQGWMQFMPATWKDYGLDANRDGKKDPYNPVDAIFAAARYLDAAGYAEDPRAAIWAYNHADWYVDDVVARARRLARVPAAMISSLTGMTEGMFPVDGRTRYGSGSKDGVEIKARPGADVVAVADGELIKVGKGEERGSRVVLEDSYGNRYVYSGLELAETAADPAPKEAGSRRLRAAGKQRIYANPARVAERGKKGKKKSTLKRGTRVTAGVPLGRVGDTRNAHIVFKIHPAGATEQIDPAPILDGWELLEKSDLYRADGHGAVRRGSGVGAVLQMSKSQLESLVLADERIDIYEGGRVDVEDGIVDRRVLATLAYLAESGLHPTVTSLRSGHSRLTASGNVSYHWSGNAADISAINGTSVLGHQEPGGVTDQAVRRLLQLQGPMRPAELISLLDYGSPSFAMGDHDDHIHVGFAPAPGAIGLGKAKPAKLDDKTWDELSLRLEEIDQPKLKKAKGGKGTKAKAGKGKKAKKR